MKEVPMIRVLDKHEQTVTFLKNDGDACPFYEELLTEVLKPAYMTYEFKVPMNHQDSDYIADSGAVVIQNEFGDLLLFDIATLEEVNQSGVRYKYVRAEYGWAELNGKVVRPQSFPNITAKQGLTNALTGTRWKVGRVEWFEAIDLDYSSHTSALGMLHDIESEYGGELVFRVEVNKFGVVSGRYVDLVKKRGVDAGQRFTVSKDLKGVKRIRKRATVATSLIGVGKGDENGNPIDFTGVEWSVAKGDPVDKPIGQDWVGDEGARKYWRGTGSHIEQPFTYDTSSPQVLLEKTWEELQRRKYGILTYEADVELLDKKVRLGDTVLVQDLYFRPELMVNARIHKKETSRTNKTANKVYLGDYKEARSNGKMLKELSAKLRQYEVVWSQGERIIKSPTAPAYPKDGQLWIETSGDKTKLEVWWRWDANLDSWVKITPTKAEEVGTYDGNTIDEKDIPGNQAKDKIDTDVGTGTIETTTGSQNKADQAETGANNYTDAEIIKVNQAIADAQLEIDAAEIDIANAQQELDGVKSDLNSAQTNLANAETDISNLRTDLGTKVSSDYVLSRGENLITNGTGYLGDNTNFSQFEFDGALVYSGAGSFYTNEQSAALESDEFIPVNSGKEYRLDFYVRANPNVGQSHLTGLSPYDIDNYRISPIDYMWLKGTQTTLAQPLNDGDTVIYLVDSTNWRDAEGDNSHLHSIVFWNYTNSYGYKYPIGTYSKNNLLRAWANGAIDRVNHTITLKEPWSGGSYATGTPVGNAHSGGGYLYGGMVNDIATEEWVKKEHVYKSFPPGTANVKFVALVNRDVRGGGINFSNIELTNIAMENNAKNYSDNTKIAIGEAANDINDNATQILGKNLIIDGDTLITGRLGASTATFLDATMEDATVTGYLYATNATFLNGSFRSATIIDANIQDATITGTLNSVGGTFTGQLSGVNGTFTGDLIGARISSNTTINVTTDAYIGNNIYLGDYSDYYNEKRINFNGGAWIQGGGGAYGNDINFGANNVHLAGDAVNSNSMYAASAPDAGLYWGVGAYGGEARFYRDKGDRKRIKIESDYGANDVGFWMDPIEGNFYFRYNGSNKHVFYGTGTKVGGTIEIDDQNLGMSPVDSPQVRISVLILDVELKTGQEQEIILEKRTAKALNGYGVFPSQPVKIRKENDRFFATSSVDCLCDFIIDGYRVGEEHIYWHDMEVS